MRVLAVAACLSAALATSAAGQSTAPVPKPDSVEVRTLIAPYELTSADATRKCHISLEPKPSGPGFQLVMDRALCGPQFGFLNEVAAWLPGIAGAILLVGRDGHTVTEFTEGVGGVYEAIRENDAVYFLANLQFVDPAQRVQITDLYGDWNLSLPDASPLCRLTLTDEVTGEGLFTARIDPDCDTTIAQFGPSAWQYDRGDLVLRSATGESLRFEPQEGNVWIKVPEKPRPLRLSRP